MRKTWRIVSLSVLASGLGGMALAATRPNIEGPWEITGKVAALRTTDGKAPPLTAEGEKMLKANRADPDGDPIKRCLPPGIPRVMMQKDFAFDIPVGPDLSGMFFEWNHLPRPIYMDIEHFQNIGPTYLGQSVGKWEGDTLIIDTNDFNDKTWLDASGLPHSEDLVTNEKIRLKNADTLEDTITFTDPKVFTHSWSTVLTFKKRPGYLLKDDYCLGRMGLVKPQS